MRKSYVTLGGRSEFIYDDVNDTITTSTGKRYDLDSVVINLVRARYNSLSIFERSQTSSYTDPIWSRCPDRILSPYIARLIEAGVL